jgi:SAM-dependent methyltransferase
MNESIEEIYAQEYFDYLKNRGFIRKFVRKFYLRDIQKYCIAKTIDFGCGTGQLLAMLPDGSVGYEVNKVVIDYCKSKGLHVEYYNPELDDYEFNMIHEEKYSTFTMNHVLEHIENSSEVINKIFRSCTRIGIKRIVFTVPGIKGFQSDKTHRTFIDMKYLSDNGLLNNQYFKLKISKYFPVNMEKFSQYFMHNELRIVFDKRND